MGRTHKDGADDSTRFNNGVGISAQGQQRWAVVVERRLQQYFRDVNTISQHAFNSASRFESVGKVLLGRESDWGFFYV